MYVFCAAEFSPEVGAVMYLSLFNILRFFFSTCFGKLSCHLSLHFPLVKFSITLKKVLIGFLLYKFGTALQFIPRWKGVLSRILPILGNVRDVHRPIFANGAMIFLFC